MLNRWKLYHARARFDIARAQLARAHHVGGGESGVMPGPHAGSGTEPTTPPLPIPSQIRIRCLFCHHSIATTRFADSFHSPAPGAAEGGTGTGLLPRSPATCIHCGKPLPKCALCLLPMSPGAEFTGAGSGKGGGDA
jgi:hypothetical protein